MERGGGGGGGGGWIMRYLTKTASRRSVAEEGGRTER